MFRTLIYINITQTCLSPMNNTTSKPSTEKANSFRNKAQEK